MRIQPQNPRENPKNPKTPNWVVLTHFKADRVSAVGANSGHHHCTRTGKGGAPPPDDRRHEISRPAAVGRAWIGPANTTTAATLGRRILSFSGHSRPTHTSLPPFLDPLNSFSWSFSPVHHRLKDTTKTNSAEGWIEFSGHHSNIWNKVRVLMSSWSLGLSIDIKFINFGSRLVSFPFSGHLG